MHDPYAAQPDQQYQNDPYYDQQYPDQDFAPAGPVDDQYGQGYYDPAMSGTDNYPPPPPDDSYDASSLASPQVPTDLSPEAMPTPLGTRGSRASRLLYMGHLPYEAGKTPIPIPGAVQEEYATPAPTQSKTMIDTQRFGGGEQDQRPSRIVRVAGVTEAPPAPPVDQSSPVPGITTHPEQNSDPQYQQLGLQGFERKDAGFAITTPPAISVGAGVTAADAAQQQAFKAPSIADLGRIPPPGSPEGMPPGFGAPPPPPMPQPAAAPYASQGLDGARGPAVDRDGRPLFVPQMPEEKEDEGAYGRRVAAVAWLIFGILAGAGISLSLKQVSLAGSVATPLLVIGMMMFTGKKWAGVLGLLGAVAYAAFLAWVGHGLLNGDAQFLGRIKLDHAPPPLVGQLFYGLGATFLLGNLLMLVGRSGVVRAVLGAFLLIVPLVAVAGTIALNSGRMLVANPLGNSSKAIIHLDDEGISFVKPEGWNTFNWKDVASNAPVAGGLTTRPRAFYLNERQDLLFAIYMDDPAKAGLAQLFSTDSLTQLEQEVTRGLPPVGQNGDTFDLQGKTFLENTYEGTTAANGKFSIITNKTQLDGRILLITITRDARANDDADEASRALNAFYKSFEITDKKANDPADGENTDS
ncbi:hypothetical protein IT570_01345 [Candidatus Sumerlaeota bacterium]|nr:hypothetical protein [Candidatus Sumerlaeota bacterium]